MFNPLMSFLKCHTSLTAQGRLPSGRLTTPLEHLPHCKVLGFKRLF